MNKTLLGVAAAIGTGLLYGASLAFTKNATNAVDPITLLGWRFGTALVAMLALIATRLVRIQITRATIRPLLVLAAFQPLIYYICETYGVMRTTASESGLILAATPVAIMLAGIVVMRLRPSRVQVIGIMLTLLGVTATVLAGGWETAFNPLGYLMLLGAVTSYALYAAFAQRFAGAASDMEKTFVMVAVGAIAFGGVTLVQHVADGTLLALARAPLDQSGFAAAVLYLALGSTIGAFFLQNVAIGRLGSTRYSTFIGLGTITTLATGAIFLHEQLSIGQFAGGAVILIGVYVANRLRHEATRYRDDG